MIRWAWGDVRLTIVDGGSLWLDGGAMFGVVPRPLWERERSPDERNRIQLAMNLLLVEDGRTRTLVDTGAGDRWDAKDRAIYDLRARTPDEYLAPLDLTPDRIDRVICTHLHFDHAGGNTTRNDAGGLSAAFPNAEYVVQAAELHIARSDNPRVRASYRAGDFEPLARDGRLRVVDGELRIDDHVRLRPAPGHTPGMQIVEVVTGQGTICFLADLVPTTSHLRYPYVMAYDLEPLRTLAEKQRVLPRAHAGAWRLIFEHDTTTPLAVLDERDGRLVARPWHPEA